MDYDRRLRAADYVATDYRCLLWFAPSSRRKPRLLLQHYALKLFYFTTEYNVTLLSSRHAMRRENSYPMPSHFSP